MTESISPKTLQTNKINLSQTVTAIYLALVLVAFFAIPILAVRWLKTPFIGGFVDHGLRFNHSVSMGSPDGWLAKREGLVFGDRLLAVDQHPVHSIRSLQKVLSGYSFGDRVTLAVQSDGQPERSILIQLTRFPQVDRVAYVYVAYAIGILCLIIAIWVFVLRRALVSGRVFAIFAGSLGFVVAGLFDQYTTQRLTLLWAIALPMVGAGVFNLALLLPHEDQLLKRYPLMQAGSFLLAFGLAIYSIFQLFQPAAELTFRQAWQVSFWFDGACVLFAILWFGVRITRTQSPVERDQVRVLLLCGLAAFVPVLIWLFISAFGRQQIGFSPLLFMPMVIYPMAAGYTIQRYRLTYSDFVFSRAVLYAIMALFVALGYALIVTGLSLFFGRTFSFNNPFYAGAIFFLFALLFAPVRNFFENLVNKAFFRSNQVFQEKLRAFGSALTNMVDFTEIIAVLNQYVDETMQPDQLQIFVYDPLSESYISARNGRGKNSDLRFPAYSGLVQLLRSQDATLYLSGLDRLPAALQADQTRLAMLCAQVFVPLPGRQRLLGWMALGPRLTGELYSTRDLNYLESLGDQAALALERAQMVNNMERQVREMNVLARVAQGVNVTISLDDIFELIYAQTTQIIPADEVRIILVDPVSKDLTQVFYVQGDERLSDQENVVMPVEQILEYEIIRQGRSILTDDFSAECQRRSVLTPRHDVYAWMGVPLNAGADTIGAFSLARRDLSGGFAAEQLHLLQAIADQAAGAIVKTRLISESERRARQLKTLNEVTRQLSSTLELDPLLKSILKSAVDILNCEAGSLLMWDAQTDELVFDVAMGPVAERLVGNRMPSSAGLVGKAFRSREPVIVVDVAQSQDWFKGKDEETGFSTKSLLVVPLLVKDAPIGVIEVINRVDGVNFTIDDQELLTAFASQAAVAIENARLYTMTDKALAARVEELSVMQRIDRELNTSLDVSRSMNITLDWAMRQSEAAAGLVVMIQPDGGQLMASQGYGEELAAYQEAYIPINLLHWDVIAENRRPLRFLVEDHGTGFLSGVRSQVVIPIQREKEVTAIILLESARLDVFTSEVLNFLQRLSDHASIAIANAQLYSAVRAANVAKSEFVSFVAHELKNPMTSIKGYTELLAAKAVGPVNDAQANFLSVIRSNIERMNTLVSDLNDLSKIEAGRLRLDFAPTSMSAVVDEVERSTRRQIDEKSQKLEIQLAENLPQVWADKSRMMQVMVNLVSNAHKYTEQGGKITLGAVRSPNQWDPQGAAEVVHIWVKDTGIGISPEDQAKIFQKFFRSEDPKTREVPGTGLGLNITRSLVEMQGGKIWFESEFRKGTTFHFTIPIAEQ